MIRRCLAMVAIAALAVATTGCIGSAELQSYPKARAARPADRVSKIRADLARVRAFASLFTGLLPTAQRDHLARLADQVDDALAIAEGAATIVGRDLAADRADQALEDYRFATGA